ncbi:hypothetical protein MVLG_00780 [Microbotryum lychnidis-dioicae p1A1 Lamole]|uniref:HTH APSES-type domain-containing protein n=1 Tax=Microbotryum lychnidis-dioicae (strain p1A1 Lamole / MvSl-1064) TaxID=683840 RepID=U5H040_USTV1|nr:hypothetical protein MVLG_00780 [Microbotryum lychnidis-dioicae p1A1 Lamole]|eukprot:KDE09062.1 hypothetical protein MVLG_00780 [Microbotryum lychnidis-dioicae p1A1 Lamole]
MPKAPASVPSGAVQIYKATYSSVPVYEFPCHGVAVMRRKSDAWLNATQILKVAGFDKPQRTRVLEREVQKDVHEKVQGGYGKYQGTWIPMEKGIALAKQYGVDHLLQPMFDFQPTINSPPLAPKHITALPTRGPRAVKAAAADGALPKKKAAPRKPTAAAARRAAAALAEEEEEEEDDDIPMDDDVSDLGDDGIADRRAGGTEGSRSPTPSENGSVTSETPSPLGSEMDGEWTEGAAGGPPIKKRKQANGSARSSNASQLREQQGLGALRYARAILDYFVSESTQVPAFLLHPPADFDANVVIDDDGHTALHWACAMGRIRIVKLLLSAGADIFRANAIGQTALMRSVMFTNNYDLRKFPELFELLHRSTVNIDRNNRSVFHYIVDIALGKGKTHAARYYLETVLNRLADYPDQVADILNFRDEEGETPLTLAARARSKRLVKLLLDHHADPKLPNFDGKTAEDYILEDEKYRETEAADAHGRNHVGLPSGQANGPEGAGGASRPVLFAPQTLHTSETAQRASLKCVPEMAKMLEQLADSFDAELADQARNATQATSLVTSLRSEIADSREKVMLLQDQVANADALTQEENQLLAQLQKKMGNRFRLGWEKWVRDEDARERAYEEELRLNGGAKSSNGVEDSQEDLDSYRQLLEHPPADADQRKAQLKSQIADLQKRREENFRLYAERTAKLGAGTKMGQYRQLIALGSGISMDQVEEVIQDLRAGDDSMVV